jgi:hypothetical protein
MCHGVERKTIIPTKHSFSVPISFLMAAPQRMSSQMEAVVRLMTGKEERTIAQKLADANRPTWEQYKKDNHDKLNLSGIDQQKMEAYRKELDEQREKLLATRGNGDKKKKKKEKRHRRKYLSSDSDDSDDSSEDTERKPRARKKEKKRKKKHSRRQNYSSDDSSSTSEGERKKKKKRHKKSKSKEVEPVEDNRYKLSSFFDKPDDS